ncbi:beta-1,3-glucanase family protein [Chitinimonas arctica]|nr:beta-1,3-glucanase family protein [Chitinimonas arctica]
MASLKLQFSNQSGVAPSQVSIGFVPGASNDGFDIKSNQDQTALKPLNIAGDGNYPFAGHWYSLADLVEGVTISAFSGRVYVAYGSAWAVQRKSYEPAQAVTDPNFFLRYDKMEMTFTGQAADVANLTSIDYWSIPLTLTTTWRGQAVQTVAGLLGNTTAQDVFDALDTLTTPPVSGVVGPGGVDGAPLPALVPGQFQQYPGGPAPGSAFARIIGPSSYPPIAPTVALPVMPYDIWTAYLGNLLEWFGPGTPAGKNVPTLGNGTIANIAGNFGGVGPNPPSTGPLSPQAYALTASIDSNLDITLSGTLGGVAGTTTMLYKRADLSNPSGIYGGNTPFYLNNAGSSTNPGNDVYGWVGGDLFSGLNIGAVGSQTTVGNVHGVFPPAMVGSLPSQTWFGIPGSFFFAGLQPTTYYNQWAAALAPLSQAYNFAYSDRFAAVFASLDPGKVDTLTLTLEPATVTMAA